MSPADPPIDPLEVFDSLPREMQECFESQEVQKLVDLQKNMDPKIFNPNLMLCIKAGLWSQPMGESDDDEEDSS